MNTQQRTIVICVLAVGLSMSGCGAEPTITPSPKPITTPKPTSLPKSTSTPRPLPTEIAISIGEEAMDVVDSWDNSVNAFVLAEDPSTTLSGLSAEEVGFWTNSNLGMQLPQNIMALYEALGEPRTSMYGCPEAEYVFTECPSVKIFFTDNSITSVVGGARVVFSSGIANPGGNETSASTAPSIAVSGCTSSDDCPDTVQIWDLFGENQTSETLDYNTEYRVSISQDKKVRFHFGWCTLDRKTLDENLKNTKFVFTIDGRSYIDSTEKEYVDQQDETDPTKQNSCYEVGGVASGWQPPHTYRVVFGFIFEKPIFDGWDTYPQGERLRTYLITIESNTPAAISTAANAPTLSPALANWNGIPIMPEALGGLEDMGDYQFTVKASATEIKAYYEPVMSSLGWDLRQDMMESIPTDLAFQEGGTFAFFKIFPEGENNVVTIHIVQQ